MLLVYTIDRVIYSGVITRQSNSSISSADHVMNSRVSGQYSHAMPLTIMKHVNEVVYFYYYNPNGFFPNKVSKQVAQRQPIRTIH